MTTKITVGAAINAPLEKVWDYYTNPKHIIHWNFAHPSWYCPRAVNDMKIGGIYNARMEAKDGSFGFDFEAVYTEIIDGKTLSYEFGGRIAVITFEERGAQTELIIVFDPETENSIDMQRDGWQAILNNFKIYAESN